MNKDGERVVCRDHGVGGIIPCWSKQDTPPYDKHKYNNESL